MKQTIAAILLVIVCLLGVSDRLNADGPKDSNTPVVVLGYNDLGMHCMNEDFSEFMILPPYNTLHAQVIDRQSEPPKLVTQGVTVNYSIPGNTHSADKTNFWTNVPSLLGLNLPLNIGLTNHGLSGTMEPYAKDWVVTGIPLTPKTDSGQINPFQLAQITVRDRDGVQLAQTQAVTPVSWELRCDFCHHGPPDAPKSVLDAHDRLHGTHLYNPSNQSPVLCGGCHAQPELGLTGQPGVSSLSHAMHNAHSGRMMDIVSMVPKGNICYGCHPGPQTQCLRDVHARMQMQCQNCHALGTKDVPSMMLAVADPKRTPWLSMPRCDNCHHRPGFAYEQPNTLYRNSLGHGGVYCEACHNSTHAITPARDDADNVQSVALQNHAGSIRNCTICHPTQPKGVFRHRY